MSVVVYLNSVSPDPACCSLKSVLRTLTASVLIMGGAYLATEHSEMEDYRIATFWTRFVMVSQVPHRAGGAQPTHRKHNDSTR
eukprot:6214830-Pleurochrysis_carterae.AAC.3